MSSSPATNAIGIEQQAAGENLNTWGVPKLNQDKQILVNMIAGFTTLSITGNTTITETNYSSTNTTETATLQLNAGAGLTAAFSLVIPNRARRLLVWNNTGYTASNIKLQSSTGLSLPTGRWAWVVTDGSTDVWNLSGNSGGVTTPINAQDIPNWSAVQTAIANASIPAAAGTVKNSGIDTTAGYLSQKMTTQISGATTTQLSGLMTMQLVTLNGGANEQLAFQRSAPYVGGFLPGGVQTSQFTPVIGTEYIVDCTSGGVTVSLSGMTTPQLQQKIAISKIGNNSMLLSGTVNGGTNFTVQTTSREIYEYAGSTWGWN